MLTTALLVIAAQMPIHPVPGIGEAVITRARSMRLPLTLEQSEQVQSDRIFAPGGAPLPIYLNRWGGEYFGGGENDSRTNTSSIVPGVSATVGPFSGSDGDWQEVLGCVEDLFSRFNVYVTEFEPTEGEYVEAVIGGTPDQLGMSFGVGGVAPWDPFGCGLIPGAIVYAFSDVYGGDNRAICETAAQEIAHAFSLDHEYLCEDPLTYLDGCGEKAFQDVYAPCGEFSERECACGRPSQNSVQLMFELLGPNEGVEVPPPPVDNEDPVITLLSPEGDVSREAHTTFEIVADASDDAGLVSVSVLWGLTGESMHCPSSGQGWTCSREGTRHTWRIDVGEGMRTFEVKARDIVGKTATTGLVNVWFGTGPDDVPPDDDTPPEVTIVTPTEGDVLQTGEEFELVATAYDADTRILGVELVWQTSRGLRAFPCPVESNWFTCTAEGGTYTWTLRSRRESLRSYQVFAYDLMGNQGSSDMLNITLSDTAGPPLAGDAFERNDTWDLATPVSCNDSLDLMIHHNDTDWLDLDAPEGYLVTVETTGNVGGDLRLTAHDGPLLANEIKAAPAGSPLVFTMPEAAKVKIRGATQGLYSVSVSCAEPPPETEERPDPGCSHTGTGGAAPLGLFALLGLALIGRGRRGSRK